MPTSSQTHPSPRLLQACALFGIGPYPHDDHVRRLVHAGAAAAKLGRLGPGQIAFITGPSGSGKSLIVGQLAGRLGGAAIVVDPSRPHRWRSGAVIDQFVSPLPIALAHLARAGRADATILSTLPRHLSEGQRFRLRLALALCRATRMRLAHQRPRSAKRLRWRAPARNTAAVPTLLVDEFCSTLDRITARNIARMLRRCIRGSHIRAICIAAGDDILEALAPEILVYQPLSAPAIIVAKAGVHRGRRDRAEPAEGAEEKRGMESEEEGERDACSGSSRLSLPRAHSIS